MKNYTVYNSSGKILRSGTCPDNFFLLQAEKGEFVMEGLANDSKHKIVSGKIADKTPQEIAAGKPPEPKPIPPEKLPAHIDNEQWQSVLGRLDKLESKA